MGSKAADTYNIANAATIPLSTFSDMSLSTFSGVVSVEWNCL